MTLEQYTTKLWAKGYCSFTVEEAQKALGNSRVAVRSAISRLKHKDELAEPIANFLLILPPEYRHLACLPAEHFVPDLMKHLSAHYYVALLCAAQYYGAAHQKPQVFQVMLNHNRRPIHCGQVKIEFTSRKNSKLIPTQTFNTPQGFITVSSPEATAMDLVTYPQHSGGLSNVLTVLSELAETIDPEKLIALTQLTKEITWVQRLGYLFELAGEVSLCEKLEATLTNKRVRKRVLYPADPLNNAELNKRWNILVNVELESDL